MDPESHPSQVISIDGVRVHRGGNLVLRGITLGVSAGQVIGLLGPSGSGKSTLIRAIVGVQQRVEGDIRVFGHPAGSAEVRHRVGYVTQSPSVYDDLSVHDNVRYFAAMVGRGGDTITRAIKQVGLEDFTSRRVSRLSGGQRSRVSLASALVGAPELLVLDEPTVGLDPTLRRELWTLFRELANDGTTLVVSSHVMEEATRCDRLLLMRNGAVMADTTPDELLRDTGQTNPEAAFLALIDRDDQP